MLAEDQEDHIRDVMFYKHASLVGKTPAFKSRHELVQNITRNARAARFLDAFYGSRSLSYHFLKFKPTYKAEWVLLSSLVERASNPLVANAKHA